MSRRQESSEGFWSEREWERYNSVGFFEEFIFGLGGVTAGAGIVLFEERVEEVCEVRHE